MVEQQSCGSLVNASALCDIEEEVKGDQNSVNNNKKIAEISAELQREREKNAQLMEKISLLETQLQNGQGSRCVNGTERNLRKFKRQKVDLQNGIQGVNVANDVLASRIKFDTKCNPSKDGNVKERLVNWMSMDETPFSQIDKLRDEELAADCDYTDDSDDDEDCEEVYTCNDHKNGDSYVNPDRIRAQKQNGVDGKIDKASVEKFSGGKNVLAFQSTAEETSADMKNLCRDMHKQETTETENIGDQKVSADDPVSKMEVCLKEPVNVSSTRKPLKVAFCSKEVKRMLESEILLVNNAQSHTIRKIIVFASLGIRHGLDDMYELDFNHFSVLRKGEPYISAQDPGEHVLYENPGVREKIFFPNRQNPALCPVQILEQEKTMRPSDPSCPSCLFLCIKYGGRTRNLPQNEYVRQRMGRNKLKSFGPVICRMAMLINIRSGSFFFKALGITLLFMAGFPDDLVQRETKYRNLDLLQKYYRTDEDAEGEQLFLSHPTTCDTAIMSFEKLTGKTTTTKSKGKKQANSVMKSNNLPGSSAQQSALSNNATSNQFDLKGYTSIQSQTMALATFQSVPPQTSHDITHVSNQVTNSSTTNLPLNSPAPYHMFPPHSANTFMPMVYWSAPNAYPLNPYASAYGYQTFPSAANYVSVYPHPYYSHPSYSSLVPKTTERNCMNNYAMEEADSTSDSSSSSTEPKEALANSK